VTIVVTKGFAWVAGPDRIAHAQRARGRAVRTLCDLPALDERFARPAALRCDRCTATADGVVA